MPGDLQALWRASTPKQYHLEYAYSCMGYEIPAAMGVRMALDAQGHPERQVVAIVGDGTYQMLPAEIATMVSERHKVIIVLLQNHGYASIGALFRIPRVTTLWHKVRMRNPESGLLDGAPVPFDLGRQRRLLKSACCVATVSRSSGRTTPRPWPAIG